VIWVCYELGKVDDSAVRVVNWRTSRKVEVRRKSSSIAQKHLAYARSPFEGNALQKSALCQKLQEIREHDILFGERCIADSRGA